MSDDEFRARWFGLDRGKLDLAWFTSLRDLYRNCTVAQKTELQSRLGWSDESCHEPENIFGANIGDRIRPHLRDENSFRSYLLSLAEGAWLEDYRDTLCHLAALYPVAILRGFDIDEILESVARQCASASATTIRGFLARADKDLSVWELRASRDTSRHVTLEHV
jgi:hypothetical protein